MSKRPVKRGGAAKPAFGGRSQGGAGMLAQIQRMQAEMEKAREALETETLEVTAGGGAIKIVVTGHQRILSIALDPQIVDPEDMEMLQDLLVAAVNQAIEQSQAMAAERLEGITGGINLPGF